MTMNYKGYCEYLSNKYGRPYYPYFSIDGVYCKENSRTREGLFLHHIGENKHIQLSVLKYARKAPYELQLPYQLVYCDYLEHLYLHILIYAEYGFPYGYGGIVNYLIPELDVLYKGGTVSPVYKMWCFDKVRNRYEEYKKLVQRFKEIERMINHDNVF